MVPGNRTFLARDYEVPKRPIFILDDWDIVQGTDAAAYVSSGVTDGVMYGTNGCVGVRHRSECETIGFQTSVFMNGVYHSLPLDTCIDSKALPEEMQVGATICDVNLDCLIDGDSGTLRAMPLRRLSLRDATYHSYCNDVMSGDGGLMFDGEYRRVVSVKELDLWGADVVYSGFSFNNSPSEMHLNESTTLSRSMGQIASSQNGEFSTSYTLDFVATITIDLCNWVILRGDSTDEFLLQSLTSGLIVNTVTQSSCLVEYSNSSCKILPDQEVLSDPDENMISPYDRPFSSVPFFSDSESDHSLANRASPHKCNRNGKRIAFKRRFSLVLTTENVPEKITLTFLARHYNGRNISPLRTFPSISDIIAEQRVIFDELWNNFYIDLQQQGELTPNRMRLALLYNAFRLFCVSYNLPNGLPRSGCSATKKNLQYDLQQYLYHGIFYTYTFPSRALELIRSLYSLLPQARINAHRISLSHGAIFPRSTIKGTECHYYSTINHARLHVNAEIGYIINIYFMAVEDIDDNDRLWLLELMLETARVWPQLGEWVENEGVFRLDNIAGPDEYNGSASGNFYIHLSAKMHLRHALKLYKQQLEILGEEVMTRLLKEIDIDISELENFQKVSDGIVIRRNDHLGVYMVHDHFHTLAEWKGERAKHPLSMNYHPLAIFRHKLVDIPEVLLGMLLYQNEFENKDFVRNLAYYKPLCTYDSPESLALVALMELHAKKSFAQGIPFLRSLMSLDLDNIIYTADEGLNFAAMSASWIAIVCGIGGLNLVRHNLHLDPCFPAGLNVVSFTLCWRGSILRTTIDANNITYDLISGDSIRFVHGSGHRIHLHSGYRRCSAKTQVSVPRLMSSKQGEFEGAIFLCESLFDDIMDINFMAWYKTLESLFENHRVLHLREIPPMTETEYVTKVIYQAEQREIAFSGIHNVLLERGIDLELGSPDDAEIVETRYGLANAKVAEMAEIVSREMPQVNSSMRALLSDLAESGIALAVVTYTRSLKALMQYNPDVLSLILAYIDGEEAYDRRIKSRPHVDIFLRAAEKIHVDPARCVVFSTHMDRGYQATALAKFRMFFDVEERFVAAHMPQQPQSYPTLTPQEAKTAGKPIGPLILRMPRVNIPTTIDALEDILYERGTADNSPLSV
ncbi:glycosyl hydrolase [Trypanosoma theileri]|uniref:Glycosyl hydrolase n=1 Tax=Trypanosoma theileri TaxID=67003 RepID=A0A1X0P9X0_9TRYP|nr:glycosyl hydrolase [Trypanosoma theileri]ORC93615.1 glycosyl hydrolase [Trypanosoma theileri]